jgi:DNA topoisomerase I
VAASVAAVLGAKERHDGYLSGNGYLVTWAFGHLVQLAMPDAYGYTGFRRENLPILPQAFKYIPRQIREDKEYKPDPGVLKQLRIIRELFSRADRLVNFGDAGREGELIFRLIYNYTGCRKPFDRLWISSLTDRAIREGLDNLRPGNDYDNLYRAAEARAIADWEIGLNATQALSIAAGQGIYSLGRVQTPTLMMICCRYLENRDFTPQTYYRLKVSAEKDGTPFAAFSELRYETLPAANATLAAVTATGTVAVADVQRREVSQDPPLLYDLTALQKEANGRYGFSADKTLSIAQSLYEKKVLSYPRTGSRYLSDDVFDEIPDRIALLERYPAFAAHATVLKGTSLNRRSVDAGKVTDHHALIITECLPGKLSADERTVYDMVAARLLEAFSARCLKDVTTVSFTAGNSVFTAKGTVIKSAGWRAVRDEDDEGMAALPPLQPGEAFPLQSAECVEKQTKPRPLHTESTLLSAMEHCGRELQDDELRDSLKENGIGTPATRASIIETLFARGYVRREKKSLVPTDKGLAVYYIVKDKRIADVEMTGQWETALAKIESGEMNPDTFRKGIEVYAAQITEELLQVQVSVADAEHIPCPKCHFGRILFYPKVAKCSNVDCSLTVFRNKGEKQLTDSQIADLVTKGRTALIKGFRSKEGKTFDAYLTFDKKFRTVYEFPPRTDRRKEKERR